MHFYLGITADQAGQSGAQDLRRMNSATTSDQPDRSISGPFTKSFKKFFQKKRPRHLLERVQSLPVRCIANIFNRFLAVQF